MESFEKKDFVQVDEYAWTVKENDSLAIPPFNYSVITKPKEALKEMEKIFSSGVFGADVETNSLSWEMPNFMMHGFSLAGLENSLYIHGRAGTDEKVLNFLKEAMNDPSITHAWYNFPFDAHSLEQYDVFYDWSSNSVEDVQIMTWLDNKEDLHGSGSLKRDALRYLKSIKAPLPSFKDILLSGESIDDIDPDVLYRYGAFDSRITYDLFFALKSILQGVESVHGDKTLFDSYKEMSLKVLHPIFKMERNGMHIDIKKLEEVLEGTTEVEETTTAFWQAVTGVNANSYKQKAHFFYDVMNHPVEMKTTEGGTPSTDSTMMHRWSSKGDPYADLYINIISPAGKIKGTYAEPFLAQIKRLGFPYIHGNLKVPGTRTGRLSSNNPNLQNIPVKGKWGKMMREVFSAPPGYDFLRADYSQLELRVLTHYTQDPHYMQVFQDNGDPHQMTADLLGIERDQAKVINFGIIYGMTGIGIAFNMEKWGMGSISEKEAEEMRLAHLEQFPVTRRWINRVHTVASELGFVETISGRRRYLPNINHSVPNLRGKDENKAVNTVVQGSAADIMNIGIINVDKLYDGYNKVLNKPILLATTVHDELCSYVPKDDIIPVEFIAQRTADGLVYGGTYFNLKVRLTVDPGLGANWGEVK